MEDSTQFQVDKIHGITHDDHIKQIQHAHEEGKKRIQSHKVEVSRKEYNSKHNGTL